MECLTELEIDLQVKYSKNGIIEFVERQIMQEKPNNEINEKREL